MQLRQEMAHLLGFKNYAEYSLATKMAESTDEVIDFLQQLADRSRDDALQDIEQLRQYASEHLDMEELEAWDLNYVAEKLKHHQYEISQELLKPYFPEHRVIEGLFAIVKRLYGIRIEEVAAGRNLAPRCPFL